MNTNRKISFSHRLIHLLALLSSLGLFAGYVARHNMTGNEYQSEFNKYSGEKKMRLTDVSGYAVNGTAYYAAIWSTNTAGPDWTARHGLSEAQYQATVTDLKNKGYRPNRISAFSVNGTPYFACIFFKPSGAWVARHDLTPDQYQAEFNNWNKEGYRLIEVCGYTKGGSTRYAAVWEKSPGPAFIARHGMTSEMYQTEFNKQWNNGYVPVRVSGFEVAGEDRYAAIWEKSANGVYARHRMTNQNYQAEFDNGWYQGMQLSHVCGYTIGGKPRFAAVWKGGSLSFNDTKLIYDKVNAYMQNSGIPGLSIAVMKDGKLVWAKGFGLMNTTEGTMVSPNSLFRIASVSKPITSAAIMRLTETTNLKLSDKVFGPNGLLGDLCSQQDACVDKTDLEKITVQHCLEHATGWVDDAVWKEYQLSNADIIKWAAKNYAQPNTPGAEFKYMNFDYFLLGRIIEKKSGQSYQNYVKSNILSKCGINDMHIGADTQAGQKPNEVTYYGGNPYDLKLTRMDANGGWIGKPIDLLKFFAGIDKLSNRKDVLKPETIDVMRTISTANNAGDYAKGLKVNGDWWMHNGCMPGTLSSLVHFKNGISIAIVVNTRPSNDECTWNGMYPLIDEIQKAGIVWPTYDLF